MVASFLVWMVRVFDSRQGCVLGATAFDVAAIFILIGSQQQLHQTIQSPTTPGNDYTEQPWGKWHHRALRPTSLLSQTSIHKSFPSYTPCESARLVIVASVHARMMIRCVGQSVRGWGRVGQWGVDAHVRRGKDKGSSLRQTHLPCQAVYLIA